MDQASGKVMERTRKIKAKMGTISSKSTAKGEDSIVAGRVGKVRKDPKISKGMQMIFLSLDMAYVLQKLKWGCFYYLAVI